MMDRVSEIFHIPARRCKRCGGLLTSEQAIQDGYGHTCKMKNRREELEREAIKDQYSFFEEVQKCFRRNQYERKE